MSNHVVYSAVYIYVLSVLTEYGTITAEVFLYFVSISTRCPRDSGMLKLVRKRLREHSHWPRSPGRSFATWTVSVAEADCNGRLLNTHVRCSETRTRRAMTKSVASSHILPKYIRIPREIEGSQAAYKLLASPLSNTVGHAFLRDSTTFLRNHSPLCDHSYSGGYKNEQNGAFHIMNRISDLIGMAVCRVHRSALRGLLTRAGEEWIVVVSRELRPEHGPVPEPDGGAQQRSRTPANRESWKVNRLDHLRDVRQVVDTGWLVRQMGPPAGVLTRRWFSGSHGFLEGQHEQGAAVMPCGRRGWKHGR